MRAISERKRQKFYAENIGREYDVLFESGQDGLWTGYTENFIRVSVENPGNLSRHIRRVKITGTVADFAMGELVDE